MSDFVSGVAAASRGCARGGRTGDVRCRQTMLGALSVCAVSCAVIAGVPLAARGRFGNQVAVPVADAAARVAALISR